MNTAMQTKHRLAVEKIRQDFPILQRRINGKPLRYLDSAASTQKPRHVIETVNEFYQHYNANIHRGVYKLSEEATLAYEAAHEKAAKLVRGTSEEIIFTKNATEALNLVAYAYGMEYLQEGDEVVLTEMEHHSQLVPWQQMAKRRKAVLKFIPVKDGALDRSKINELITKKTKVVAITHVSNVLGTINPVKEIGKVAHDQGAVLCVDGAQAVPHMPVDVRDLDADFYAFSSHKMLGPTGIGVLYGKKTLLEEMPPFLFGGDMISEVQFHETKWNELPWKFEAGTGNIAGSIGFGAAIDYLQKIDIERIQQHEQELAQYALAQLQTQKDVTLYGPDPSEERAGIVSFNIGNAHPHDVAQILGEEGICIRGGHHCAQPLMQVLGVPATSRVSFYLYNTKEEIDACIAALDKVRKVFG